MYKGKYIFYYYACFSIEKRNFGLYVKKYPLQKSPKGAKDLFVRIIFPHKYI